MLENMYMPSFRKETGKKRPAGDSSSLLNHWVIQTMLSKRLNTAGANQMTVFMNGLVNQWFTQANDSDSDSNTKGNTIL